MKKGNSKLTTVLLVVLNLTFMALNAQEVIDVQKYANHNLQEMEREADILYLQNAYAAAAATYLKVADKNMDHGDLYYKLSRCYARLKKPTLAANFLAIAINNGFFNIQGLEQDEAFNGIRNNINFSPTYLEVLDFAKNTGGKIYYVDVERKIKCRVFMPDDYDASKSYPMIVGLHGFGSGTEDLANIWNTLEERSFILIIPEAPYDVRVTPSLFPQHSWGLMFRNKDLIAESDDYTLEYIARVAKEFKEEFKVSKTILMGFSQGTSYAYAAAIRYAQEFDGLMCFAGSFPNMERYPSFVNEEDLKKNKQLKVFISHGRNDRVDLKHSKNAAKLLKKHKYTVKLDITDLGHQISKEALQSGLNWHEI